eukprot:m.143347 g.143347  ORF g.143347 m.143347 type:complete len:696 (-) comp13205_c0_seq2:681-2768(-)
MNRQRSSEDEKGLEDQLKALQIDNSVLRQHQQRSATRSAALFARKNRTALGKAGASFANMRKVAEAAIMKKKGMPSNDNNGNDVGKESGSNGTLFSPSSSFSSSSSRRQHHRGVFASPKDKGQREEDMGKKDGGSANRFVQYANIKRKVNRFKKQNEKRGDLDLTASTDASSDGSSSYNPKDSVVLAAAMSAARLSALGKAASISLSELKATLPSVSAGRKTMCKQKVTKNEDLFNVQTTVDKNLVKILTPIIEELHSEDHDASINALRILRKKVSTVQSPPIETYLHMHAFDHVVQELTRSEPHCFEGIWMLSNLTAGNTRQTRLLLDLNIVEVFATCLSHESLRVASQSVWGLANIAGDCSEFRDLLIEQNALPALLSHAERLMLSSEKGQDEKKVSWVSRGVGPTTTSNNLNLPALPSTTPSNTTGNSTKSAPNSPKSTPHTAPRSMPSSPLSGKKNEDDDNTPEKNVRRHRKEFETLVWCLSNLCRGKPEVPIDRVEEIVPLFLYVVREFILDPYFDGACVDAVWGLSYLSGRQDNLMPLMAMDVLPTVLDALKRVPRSFKVFTPLFRIVGNFAVGPSEITSHLIQTDILPFIVNLLTTTSVSWLKREALWLISNLAASDSDHVAVLMDLNVLVIVLEMLGKRELDEKQTKEARWVVKNMYLSGTPQQKEFVKTTTASTLPFDFGDFEGED